MKKQFLMIVIIGFLLFPGASGFARDGHGKNMGIAINPVLALFEWGSGEINFWSIDRNAEINIPIQYMNNPFFLEDESSNIRFISLGLYYRRFFNEKQKGFFIQAGWKYDYARVKDELGSSNGSINSLLFGFGYRVIAKNGLFCTGLALDIDLFKFGIAW
jgi:hypothetical protein